MTVDPESIAQSPSFLSNHDRVRPPPGRVRHLLIHPSSSLAFHRATTAHHPPLSFSASTAAAPPPLTFPALCFEMSVSNQFIKSY